MANVFLNTNPRDIETAIMLEQAITHDIGKAVAYTNGRTIYINTDNNLNNILPAYNIGMLKWLLWHERMHIELNHHKRFFNYARELEDKGDKINISMQEVNIIMDILVHDQLSKWLPELVDTAKENLAQFRNRNSLKYTFTTYTLEEMLDEYINYKEEDKHEEDPGTGEEAKEGESEDTSTGTSTTKEKKSSPDTPSESEHRTSCAEEFDEESETPEPEHKSEPTPEHDMTDWDKLDDIDQKEFLTGSEAHELQNQIDELKRKKIKLGKLTETLNGLATSTRRRTYAKPNPVKLSSGAVLKGSTPGKAQLYLCFDASGSMYGELNLFKEIIQKSIPQAMECPCCWFSGSRSPIKAYKTDDGDRYYKGKFKDIIPVNANNGYSDDGDRTIELCWEAEQQGYSPIGVTDGGGSLSWSKDKLKQLKRTVFVGQNHGWLEAVKRVNPRIQTLEL